jgi:endonuclease/exonuclease/phosphatase family metal-dependent hydrolase
MHPTVARALAATLLVLTGASCGGSAPQGPVTLKVVSFNLMCSFCGSADFDPWADRLVAFKDIFARHAPDLVGTQELFAPAEVAQIAAALPGEFGSLYFHDPEGKGVIDYPDAAIFYRKSLFEVQESGLYWLSRTPDVAWSGGWADTQFWRIVYWARLRHTPSGRVLYFATTHFDNNKPNQDMSAPLALGRSAPLAANTPFLLVGDFNSEPGTTAYATLTKGVDGAGFAFTDGYAIAGEHVVLHNQATAPSYDPAQRIDHVFLAGPAKWSVPRWFVDLYKYGANNRYPSDHFAVSAELVLQ